MHAGTPLLTAALLGLVWAGFCPAGAAPSEGAPALTYKVDGVVYTSRDDALKALHAEIEGDLQKIQPLPGKIGGRLLVVLPDRDGVRRLMTGAQQGGDPVVEWKTDDAILRLNANAAALVRSGLFDNVLVMEANDPGKTASEPADYRLWIVTEPKERRWVLAGADGRSTALKLSRGYARAEWMAIFTIAVSNAGAELGAPIARIALPPDRSSPDGGTAGTGFFVDAAGGMLTNAHVVKGCKSVKAALPSGEVAASVTALDANNDLALLKVAVAWPSFASFRAAPPVRQGEDVIVYGFPYAGALSTKGNLTTGIVSALAGLRDDTRIYQISAPVQPGNSGGPLLDDKGEVIGVVVAKMNALGVAKATGDVPQNVNFAIKASIANEFLASNGITAQTSHPKAKHSTADIGDVAKGYTFMVRCQK